MARRVLFLVREPFPTFRADVECLFGKYLPRLGLMSDYVAESACRDGERRWGGGEALVCQVPSGRLARQLKKALWGLYRVATAKRVTYHGVQVRDMAITAAAALFLARLRGIPFIFWMSFPMVEMQLRRADAIGMSGGARFWYPKLQGLLGRLLLNRLVLKKADLVVVQSEQMARDLRNIVGPSVGLLPVPMGVDVDELEMGRSPAEPRYVGRQVVSHIGVLSQVRDSEQLLDFAERLRDLVPKVMLVLIGDAETEDERQHIRRQIQDRGLAAHVDITGWVSRREAWSYVSESAIGVSYIPRSPLFDCASPTKVVETLALGVPMVVNDQPDQCSVINESGAGVCVSGRAEEMAHEVARLLACPEVLAEMGARGREYIARTRSYAALARLVADRYQDILRV